MSGGPGSDGYEGVLRIIQNLGLLNLTIISFSVISRKLVGGGLTPLQRCPSPQDELVSCNHLYDLSFCLTTTTTTTTIIIIIVDFAVPADHRIKLKESEKKAKFLDLARELKKLWNMKVTIIPIVIGAFGTVTKGLLKGLDDLEVGGRVETIQTIALLRTARILRRVSWKLEETQTPVKDYQLTLM